MPFGRPVRLIASILFLLLIGWTVRWWRSRTDSETMRMQIVPGLEDNSAPEIDLPRE